MIFSQKGLSLIEVIMSMWIVGLIVFSTMVCTSDIETKMDQRKIQALSLAKSELDKLRYRALKGFLVVEKNLQQDTMRNYTMIIWTLDRKKVKFDQDTGDIAELGQDLGNIDNLNLIYDNYKTKDVQENPLKSLGLDYVNGNFIESFENVKNPKDRLAIKQNLETALAVKLHKNEQSEQYQKIMNLTLPFVVDVKIDMQTEANDNGISLYLYNIKLVVGWFEQRNGMWHLTSDTYASRVTTEQKPSVILEP